MVVEIFFCYAREDEELRKKLEKQLRALKRQGIIGYGMTGRLAREPNGNVKSTGI